MAGLIRSSRTNRRLINRVALRRDEFVIDANVYVSAIIRPEGPPG